MRLNQREQSVFRSIFFNQATKAGTYNCPVFVDIIEPQKNNLWRLVGIFGDQKIIRGRIREMHLVDHKIFFETQTA